MHVLLHKLMYMYVCVQVKAASQWWCYMCSPESDSVGLLTRRHNWDLKLQELFLTDHETEYVSVCARRA